MSKKIIVALLVFTLFGGISTYLVKKNLQLREKMIACYILEHENGDYQTCYSEVLPKFKQKYTDYYLKSDYWIMATAISDPDMDSQYRRLLNDEKAAIDLLFRSEVRRELLENISTQWKKE